MLAPKPQKYKHHVMSTFGRQEQIREISPTKFNCLSLHRGTFFFKTESAGTADSSQQMMQSSPIACFQSRRLKNSYILVNDWTTRCNIASVLKTKGLNFELV